ncbi:MAG: right-handed parallel beta-helix repeat-containing protein, partial [Mangrovibacterium sp.]
MNKTGYVSLRCFCLFVLLTWFEAAMGQTIVEVTDFGVKANSFVNASQAIKKAIESCRGKSDVILKLPEGRIDLWPEDAVKKKLYVSNSTEDDQASKVKSIGFWFEGLTNFTLEGNNALIVLHGKMVSFGASNCNGLKIRNISFDYDRPSMSELTIKSVSSGVVEAEIHPDSRYTIMQGRIIFYGEGWRSWSHHAILFNPEKETMHYSSFKPFLESKAVETSPFHVRFEGDFSKAAFHPGDVLTIRDPYRDNCGGFILHCTNVSVENIKLHYMHGLGIVSQFSENILMRKVTAAPRKDSGRIISSFADCFHFSGCKGLVQVDSCFTSGSHDDPINVHGTHLKITGVYPENKLIVRFMHHQTYGFEAFFTGDSIAFVNPQTLQLQAFAKVKTARLLNLREMELELDGTLPAAAREGNVIENLTWTPEVRIMNSRFERTNTRGLLITTRRKVLIENNTFFRTGMHAILIANDASSWYESGPVTDVTIRNNVFENCGYNQTPGNYIIAIAPENHELVKNQYVHSNIRIENNTFKSYDYPVLTARSVENLIFTGNTIIRSGFLPEGNSRPAFSLTTCT